MEKKFLSFVEARKDALFFAAINILGLLVRLGGKDFVSSDMGSFFLPWFETIREAGGMAALSEHVTGTYGIPFQFLLAVTTYLPFKPLYMLKFLFCIFDFGLAWISAKFVCDLRQSKSPMLFSLTYGTVLLVPTVILNSSVWGQCDVIYSFFAIAAIYALYRDQFGKAFCLLGASLAFKFQAIFIVPFFLIYYVMEKKFSLVFPRKKSGGSNFRDIWPGGLWLTLFTFYVLNIPGFLMKRSLLDPIWLYIRQGGAFRSMWLNFPSIWALLGDNYDAFHNIAIYITIAVLGMGLFWCMHHRVRLQANSNFMSVLIWSVWTVLLFLPAMHERYAYILDLLLVIYTFLDKSAWKYAVATLLCSLATYGNYLCGNGINVKCLSVVFTAAYMFFTVYRFMDCRGKEALVTEPYKERSGNEQKNIG